MTKICKDIKNLYFVLKYVLTFELVLPAADNSKNLCYIHHVKIIMIFKDCSFGLTHLWEKKKKNLHVWNLLIPDVTSALKQKEENLQVNYESIMLQTIWIKYLVVLSQGRQAVHTCILNDKKAIVGLFTL